MSQNPVADSTHGKYNLFRWYTNLQIGAAVEIGIGR